MRELRADRDELRRNERAQQIKMENQEALVAQVEAHAKDTEALQAACGEMEEAVEMAIDGTRRLPERMSAVAEMVTVMGAEMLSLQRQRDDFLRMVHDANAREDRLRDELTAVQTAVAESKVALQEKAVLADHLNAVKLKRDEWCKKVSSHAPSVFLALRYAQYRTGRCGGASHRSAVP